MDKKFDFGFGEIEIPFKKEKDFKQVGISLPKRTIEAFELAKAHGIEVPELRRQILIAAFDSIVSSLDKKSS